MSNVYRYKNCLKLNLWNCNWDNNLPEIDGHATCIFNVITRRFRIWLRPKCINNVWTKFTEITIYSELTRQYVIKAVEKRLYFNSNNSSSTGVIELSDCFNTAFGSTKFGWRLSRMLDFYMDELFFIFDNYVGNPDANPAKLKNQVKAHNEYLMGNLNPKILRTRIPEVDIRYMLSILFEHRRIPYLQRCKKINL